MATLTFEQQVVLKDALRDLSELRENYPYDDYLEAFEKRMKRLEVTFTAPRKVEYTYRKMVDKEAVTINGCGFFHAWSIDDRCPVGIIENYDGQVICIAAEKIKFINE